MAQLFPEDFQLADTEQLHKGEYRTLQILKEGLSDQYMVFHGVHWTKVENDSAIYGEIDFLILNPYGRVLAIEQKETQIEVNKFRFKLHVWQLFIADIKCCMTLGRMRVFIDIFLIGVIHLV